MKVKVKPRVVPKNIIIILPYNNIIIVFRHALLIIDICCDPYTSDINECVANPCHPNATCMNTNGTFTCVCDAEYEGNGFTCQGIYILSMQFTFIDEHSRIIIIQYCTM